MTEQPARLAVTPEDHRTAQEIISLVAGALAEPDGCLDPDDIAAIVGAHRLAHTVPGDAELRAALELARVFAWNTLSASENPGQHDLIQTIDAALPTSPVIDTDFQEPKP